MDNLKINELVRKWSENTVKEIKNCLSWTQHIKNSISYQARSGSVDFMAYYYAPYLDNWLKYQPTPKYPRKKDPPGLGKPTFLNIPEDNLDQLMQSIAEELAKEAGDQAKEKLE